MSKPLLASGEVAAEVGLPRWQLLYLIERGTLPGPSYEVPGRRLFTPDDIERLKGAIKKRIESLNKENAQIPRS